MYSTKRTLNNAHKLVCDSGQLELCNMASNHLENKICCFVSIGILQLSPAYLKSIIDANFLYKLQDFDSM